MEVLESFKGWAKKIVAGYRNFLQCDTSVFWIIDSVLQVTINFPTQLDDVFVADVTRCYETIPLQGPDNLLAALHFVTNIGFKEALSQHPKAVNKLWIKFHTDGAP